MAHSHQKILAAERAVRQATEINQALRYLVHYKAKKAASVGNAVRRCIGANWLDVLTDADLGAATTDAAISLLAGRRRTLQETYGHIVIFPDEMTPPDTSKPESAE